MTIRTGFFEDLKNGEQISLLIAPSFQAVYSTEYSKVLGALREMGAKRMLSISLGADICTWAYLKGKAELSFSECIVIRSE